MKSSKYLFIIIILIINFIPQPSYAAEQSFSDVPKGHWAEAAIIKLRDLQIIQGMGNNEFGLGQTITRAEFITFLVRINKWSLIKPVQSSYTDNEIGSWYYSYIETALTNGALTEDNESIRPTDAVTREEMAVMITRSLGFDALAGQLNNQTSSFSDVVSDAGYIELLKDFGIVVGSGNSLYKPSNTATREEVAVILVRMYDKLQEGITALHGFYSDSSYSQEDLIEDLSSISFNWLSLNYDDKQNHITLNSNFPINYQEPLQLAKAKGMPVQLMLQGDNSNFITLKDGTETPILQYLLDSEDDSQKLIGDITKILNTYDFSGITIDFESLKGSQTAEQFNEFLKQLKAALILNGKKLYVAVHPFINEQSYYDGYDFATIGNVADQIILMAHDYEAKRLTQAEMSSGYTYTPLTPIKSVYEALKAITNPTTGVHDHSKVWLQISFSSAQWQLSNSQVINNAPYVPTYDMIQKRLIQNGVTIHFDTASQNPYATYTNDEQIDNVIWYEDSKSVSEKINLAKMFGIQGISIWRLGNIPADASASGINLDVWQTITEMVKQ